MKINIEEIKMYKKINSFVIFLEFKTGFLIWKSKVSMVLAWKTKMIKELQ